MCRINAILGEPSEMRDYVFHLLMLHSSTEPWQYDGWGMTDGMRLVKSQARWAENGKVLESASNLLLGHIRAASNKTEISDRAAHPYRFSVLGNSWFGVHNGALEELGTFGTKGPDTDTYRALYILNRMMLQRTIPPHTLYHALCEGLFAEWMLMYGSLTTFAFGIHTGDSLLLVREGSRPLYRMNHEDMTLVSTSVTALRATAAFCKQYTDLEGFEEPLLLPENTLMRLQLEREEYQPITYQFAVPKRRKARRWK